MSVRPNRSLTRPSSSLPYTSSRYARLGKNEEEVRKPLVPIQGAVDLGPPPTMAERTLLFDSLARILRHGITKAPSPSSNSSSSSNPEETSDIPTYTGGVCVWSMGSGFCGQLGIRSLGRSKCARVPVPIYLPPGVAVRQVACGARHTALVCDAGNVYTFGDARSLQLGYTPKGSNHQPTPALVETLKSVRVLRVALGHGHSIALTDKGELYSWGASRQGQCGHGDRQRCATPRLLSTSLRFTDVACGKAHTLAVSVEGVVYAWGGGESGQLGLGSLLAEGCLSPCPVPIFHDQRADEDDLQLPEQDMEAAAATVDARTRVLAGALAALIQCPRSLYARERVVSVAAGALSSACVTETGRVLAWGFGEHLHSGPAVRHRPHTIAFREPIRQVAVGEGHMLALGVGGNVYALGDGAEGQLGHGANAPVSAPRLVLQGKDVRGVACGRHHSIAMTGMGMVYAWGSNLNGQCGHGSDMTVSVPRVVAACAGAVTGMVAAGGLHTVLLSGNPWKRLDAAVGKWAEGEDVEWQVKVARARGCHSGLTREDLAVVAAEVSRVRAEEEAAAQEHALVEVAEAGQTIAHALDPDRERAHVREELRKQEQQGHWKGSAVGGRFGPLVEYFAFNRQGVGSGSGDAWEREREGGRGFSMGPLRPQSAPVHTGSARNSAGAAHGDGSAGMGLTAGELGGGDGRQAWLQHLRATQALIADIKRVTETVVPAPGSASACLRQVSELRRQHDLLRDKSASLQTRLVRLEDDLRREQTVAEAALSEGGSSTATASIAGKGRDDKEGDGVGRVQALLTRLSTIEIKLQETHEDQRDYQANVAHMREDALVCQGALQTMRQQLSDCERALRRLITLRARATQDKERVGRELELFRTDVRHYSAYMRKQLDSLGSVASQHRSRREAKENKALQRREKVLWKRQEQVQELRGMAVEVEKERAEAQKQLTAVQERLQYFAHRYQQVVAATGLTEPAAIAHKWAVKDELRRELEGEVASKKAKVEQLATVLRDKKEELSALKRARAGEGWRCIDSATAAVEARAQIASKRENEVSAMRRTATLVCEGLSALLATIPHAAVADSDRHVAEVCVGVRGAVLPVTTSIYGKREDREMEGLLAYDDSGNGEEEMKMMKEDVMMRIDPLLRVLANSLQSVMSECAAEEEEDGERLPEPK